MFNRMNRTERALILTALVIATLVVCVILTSLVVQAVRNAQPTPTLRSLPAVWTATLPEATATLRPSSTPLPTRTLPALGVPSVTPGK
jgi:hypothetical protein